MSTATVVGSGPNGLAAAVVLARAGLDVTVLERADAPGGGTRSGELTLPGLVHDHCSAFHPLVEGSPLLSSLGLERHGLQLAWPEVQAAHPLDDGTAGALLRSVDATADGLGDPAWRRVFGPTVAGFDDLVDDLLRPIMHVPSHPLRLAAFGPLALLPAAGLARLLRTDAARALWAGCAAHAKHPMHRPVSAAVGLMLLAAAHRHGWPVAVGGSQSIADALVADLVEHGGRVELGVDVTGWEQLPASDVVLLDTAPDAAVRLLGDRMPARVRRAYTRYRRAPGAFKVDLAVEGGVPWTAEACRRAGTVHLGGTFEEVAASQAMVHAGRMPVRPFVLVGQQSLADPSRAVGDVHPVWAYADVPHGWEGDATEAVLGQVERFAPGTRDRVLATSVTSPAGFEAWNPNFRGGDVITGANTARQAVLRPRVAVDPYATGVDGVFLCSAATPPGAGAHGMCGANAATSALRHLDRSGSHRPAA